MKAISVKSLSFCFVVALVNLFGPLLPAACAGQADDLIVSTKAGRVKGVKRAGGGAEFLGIPYAQPPVGARRWREPVTMKSWSGIRDATTFGAPCAQSILGDWNRHDSEASKEDCLFLNVIIPAWPAKTLLPVMFWIHGGANAGGTASSSLYKDGTLINHGVVLVTINYRLGVFGFFSHPELTQESSHHASGNYGLMDQIAGLRWVHNNIAKFGGDPNNVTVFGQSAGGQDTSLLMTSPLTKGLFHRAIVQSGSAINPPCPSLIESEKSGQRVASTFKPPIDNQTITYLRGLSAEQLLARLGTQDPTQPPLIGPNIDGWIIPRSPDQVFLRKEQLPIPLIIGTTTREFGFDASVDQLRKFIETVTGTLSDRALKLYGLADNGQGTNDPVYGPAGNQWIADLVFRCPVSIQAGWHSTLNRSTFQYELARAIPGHEEEGAVHSADLPYVFGFYPTTGNLSGKFGETDFKLAALVETYWTNFAKTGNPNSGAVPRWPELDTTQSLIRFTQNGEVTVRPGGLRPAQCELLREVLKHRMQGAQ